MHLPCVPQKGAKKKKKENQGGKWRVLNSSASFFLIHLVPDRGEPSGDVPVLSFFFTCLWFVTHSFGVSHRWS
ncbi:hypothetical protein V8C40DRAFT_230751 [Trichoderma camerunense]